jgi:hypothetical protein
VKDRKDLGREAGKKLAACFGGRREAHEDVAGENTSLLTEPGTDDEEALSPIAKAPPLPMSAAFTFQSTMNVIYYASLALHSLTFDQLLPVFMSYPPQDPSEWHLPFKFAGGFGLLPAELGKIFSIYGIFGMLMQVSR